VLVGQGGTYRLTVHLVLGNIDFDLYARHIMDNTTYVLVEARAGKLFCQEWRRI
jgi:hypothetical protein